MYFSLAVVLNLNDNSRLFIDQYILFAFKFCRRMNPSTILLSILHSFVHYNTFQFLFHPSFWQNLCLLSSFRSRLHLICFCIKCLVILLCTLITECVGVVSIFH